MSVCKYCGLDFGWGQKADGKWVALIPAGQEGDKLRDYVDEAGALRSSHAQICNREPTVRVSKLAVPLSAGDILSSQARESIDMDTGEIKPKKRYKMRKK